jgi:TolA-binding protein
MDAVTYPNSDVAQYLNEHFVPVRLQIDQHKDQARRFGAKWTPGLFWLDAQGVARHQNVGYFHPEELLAECAYARGLVAVRTNDWQQGLERFEEVLLHWPRSFAAPAALYWAGAAVRMTTGNSEDMLERWQRLLREYAGTAWAMKVSFLDQPKHG